MQATYGLRRYSFFTDCFFINLLFIFDMLLLGVMESPVVCLTRIGYLYFLFDKSTSFLSRIMAGMYVLLVATVQSGALDRELIALLCLYSIAALIRPVVQMSNWLWVFLTVPLIMLQYVYLEGLTVQGGPLAWTAHLLSVTLIGSIICVWLGHKVGRAIA